MRRQRQQYHRTSFVGKTYYPIMSKISNFISVPIGFIDRVHSNGIRELGYVVISQNYLSNYIILSYLLKYPLLTYKFSQVPVLLELLKLSQSNLHKNDKGIILLNHLKQMMSDYSVKNHTSHIFLNGPYFN